MCCIRFRNFSFFFCYLIRHLLMGIIHQSNWDHMLFLWMVDYKPHQTNQGDIHTTRHTIDIIRSLFFLWLLLLSVEAKEYIKIDFWSGSKNDNETRWHMVQMSLYCETLNTVKPQTRKFPADIIVILPNLLIH